MSAEEFVAITMSPMATGETGQATAIFATLR